MGVRDWFRRAAVAGFRRLERAARDEERRQLAARFGAFGRKSRFDLPIHLAHPENVFVGARVRMHAYCRLETIVEWKLARSGPQRFSPRLEIGDDCLLAYGVHIGCAHRVTIGRGVGMGSRVYISDHGHEFEDPDVPLREQPLTAAAEVVIEDDVYLGEGVVVMPGVHIGRHTAVAANSVVNRDLPAFCVAAGMPARILKRYDLERREWKVRLG